MAKFKLSEILEATGGELIQGSGSVFSGITIDSRNTPRGSLFIAIKGERHDGHSFVKQAFNNGAKGALVSKLMLTSSVTGKAVILVEDTTKALQDIAAWHRARFKKLIVVGVTGSNGKTTVKDMTAAALAQKYKTLKTEGNLNNHIGAPLTLLRLTENHQAAVIEMGINAPGEMKVLAAMAKPKIGVITNIGPAHLEGLKSVAGVRKAKGELLKYLGKKGVSVLNADDPNSAGLIKLGPAKVVTFGKDESADVNLVDTWSNGKTGSWAVTQKGAIEQLIHVPLPGPHNVENALAAYAAAVAAGVDPAAAAKGIKKVKPAAMRMADVTLPNGARLINDCYNANPASVEAALETVSALKGDGKFVFVFGDMLELGAKSEAAHKKIARSAKKAGVDSIFSFGKMAAVTSGEADRLGMKSRACKSHESIAKLAAKNLKPSDVILVKGSRGMAMEHVIENLIKTMES